MHSEGGGDNTSVPKFHGSHGPSSFVLRTSKLGAWVSELTPQILFHPWLPWKSGSLQTFRYAWETRRSAQQYEDTGALCAKDGYLGHPKRPIPDCGHIHPGMSCLNA